MACVFFPLFLRREKKKNGKRKKDEKWGSVERTIEFLFFFFSFTTATKSPQLANSSLTSRASSAARVSGLNGHLASSSSTALACLFPSVSPLAALVDEKWKGSGFVQTYLALGFSWKATSALLRRSATASLAFAALCRCEAAPGTTSEASEGRPAQGGR